MLQSFPHIGLSDDHLRIPMHGNEKGRPQQRRKGNTHAFGDALVQNLDCHSLLTPITLVDHPESPDPKLLVSVDYDIQRSNNGDVGGYLFWIGIPLEGLRTPLKKATPGGVRRQLQTLECEWSLA